MKLGRDGKTDLAKIKPCLKTIWFCIAKQTWRLFGTALACSLLHFCFVFFSFSIPLVPLETEQSLLSGKRCFSLEQVNIKRENIVKAGQWRQVKWARCKTQGF